MWLTPTVVTITTSYVVSPPPIQFAKRPTKAQRGQDSPALHLHDLPELLISATNLPQHL